MWNLENAYRDRSTLLVEELKEEKEELEAQMEALRKQLEALNGEIRSRQAA